MFRALGAEIHERRGSSVIIKLNGEVETVHRPHPRPEALRKRIGSADARLS